MSKVIGLLTAAALGLAALPTMADPAADATAGIWQKHEYSFAYLGFTSTYSCDGLASKLKLLLIASGARADAKAQPGACAASFGRPDKFARADLVFYTLAATADGVWKPVVLASHHPFDLAVGDCELVEQFKTSVLPLFATRNVDSHSTCIPYQDSGSVIDLKFESFVAAPQHT